MNRPTTHRRVRVAALLAALPLAASPLLVTPAAHAEGGVSVTADVPPAGVHGWYQDSPSVGLEVSAEDGVEGGSGWKVVNDGVTIDSGPLDVGTTTIPVTREGTNTVSWKVIGPTGRISAGSRDLKVDHSAPTLQVDSPLDGAVLNQGEAVHATFTCDDAVSGINACAGNGGNLHQGDLIDTTPGTHELHLYAIDFATNVTSRTITYRVMAKDTTAPTVEGHISLGGRGNGGWYTDPTITFRATAVDPEIEGAVTSGLHHLDTNLDGQQLPSSPTSPVEVMITGEGEHTIKWAAADNADNASGVESLDVKIDSVKPSISLSYPTEGAVLSPDSDPVMRFGCTDEGSGIHTCHSSTDQDTAGPELDLTPGAHVAEVFATDNASNSRVVTVHYTVPGAESPSRTRIRHLELHHGSAGSAVIVVKAEGEPGGTVRIMDGKKVIGTAPVIYKTDSGDTGRATLDLPSLSRGVHRIRAVYTGTQLIQPSKSKVLKVRVR